MTQTVKKAAAYEAEIENIDKMLESLAVRIEELTSKRRKLVDKRKYTDIAATLEYIEDMGLSLDDVLDFVNKEHTKKRREAHDRAH